LKLRNEREPQIDIRLFSIEARAINELSLGFLSKGDDHLSAARARAMASAAGTSRARPLSISERRRSTSVAHACSLSGSSLRLASRCLRHAPVLPRLVAGH